MTEEQRSVILDYLAYLIEKLRLRDWTIRLSHDHPDNDECNAMIDPVVGRKLATIYLCKDFCSLSEQVQTHSLCHELIHLHHISATDIIRLDLPQQLSQAYYDLLWGTFKRQIEYCVDGLADAFSLLVSPINYNSINEPQEKTNETNQPT